MKLLYYLFVSLLVACHTKTSNNLAPTGPADSLISTKSTDAVPQMQQVYNDSTYIAGDYLFVGAKGIVFDFFPTYHPPAKLRSRGDTLYTDSAYTILVDDRKGFGPIYKKYIPSYQFKDYRTDKLYQGRLSAPNFSTDPPSRYYRTVIREACADSMPNFAGQCSIANWGCGTECGMMALVDRTNGRVFYSGKYLPFDSLDGHYGIDFRKDSKLLIVNSYLLDDFPGYVMQDGWRKLSFYEWNGSGFIKLK